MNGRSFGVWLRLPLWRRARRFRRWLCQRRRQSPEEAQAAFTDDAVSLFGDNAEQAYDAAGGGAKGP